MIKLEFLEKLAQSEKSEKMGIIAIRFCIELNEKTYPVALIRQLVNTYHYFGYCSKLLIEFMMTHRKQIMNGNKKKTTKLDKTK